MQLRQRRLLHDLILVLGSSGCRVTEIVNSLKWKNIDEFERNEVNHVKLTVWGKGEAC